jgi:hypothetical protein
MKASTLALRNLLATGVFVRADLWTITLNGGATIIRWTSHDVDLTWGGNTFTSGPLIERSSISEKIGMDVASLQLIIDATDDDTVSGKPVIQLIAAKGFDGASVKLERAYAPAWGFLSPGVPIPITGTVVRFAGKVTSIESILGSTARLNVSSWLILLNAQTPRNHFQTGCMRVLYDARCGVNPASFSATGTVTVGGTTSFGSALAPASGYYSQGRVVFLTGANAGVSRTIRTSNGSGTFTLLKAPPLPIAIGDTFTVYAGCDHTKATCFSKFNNLIKFKGTPFVPLPTTALGAPAANSGGGSK